jgi:hypothetical protein
VPRQVFANALQAVEIAVKLTKQRSVGAASHLSEPLEKQLSAEGPARPRRRRQWPTDQVANPGVLVHRPSPLCDYITSAPPVIENGRANQ